MAELDFLLSENSSNKSNKLLRDIKFKEYCYKRLYNNSHNFSNNNFNDNSPYNQITNNSRNLINSNNRNKLIQLMNSNFNNEHSVNISKSKIKVSYNIYINIDKII